MYTTAIAESGYRNLPLSMLDESSTNPRRTFEPSKLVELAHSLTVHGLIQPITVRPKGERFERCSGSQALPRRADRGAGRRTDPHPGAFRRAEFRNPANREQPTPGRSPLRRSGRISASLGRPRLRRGSACIQVWQKSGSHLRTALTSATHPGCCRSLPAGAKIDAARAIWPPDPRALSI